MKLKTKLTGVAAAVAVAIPMLVPGAAFAQTAPAQKCIFLANGSGFQVCFTPLAGAEVAGIQIGEGGSVSLPMDPVVEVAGVQLSPTLGLVSVCVFQGDEASIQTCAIA
jgi:hypothetical protein